MTRELEYLDKTVTEPRGHYLVVLMKHRTSHYIFVIFFPREFLKNVDASDQSLRQELNPGVKVLLAKSLKKP